MQESIPVGVAEGPLDQATTSASSTAGSLSDPRALQILSTEHWSLLAGRSLAYNEAFSRAGMFLSFLSATLIVIGFLIGTQGLSSDVVPVAAILLLADLFIGLATVSRLISASSEELQCLRGMNRIRHAYREMVPGIEPYFVSGFHDDARGVLAAYGDVRTVGGLGAFVHGLSTTVGMIGTIDAMIFGALCGLTGVGLGTGAAAAVAVAVAGFVLAVIVVAAVGQRSAMRNQANAESRFPTPPDRVA